jgi:hypothetical protein
VLLALVSFVVLDPYRVVRTYDEYFLDPVKYPARIGMNKGIVTIANYKARMAEGYRYNAYIFGASISCYYDVDDWVTHLAGDKSKIMPIHFDSSSEAIEELANKVEYLHATGADIDYALVVLDPIVMRDVVCYEPYCVDPPELNPGLLHKLRYYYVFLRASANIDYYKSWVTYCLTGVPRRNGHYAIFEEQPIVYDAIHNQERLPQWDSIISADPESFYTRYPLIPSPEHMTEGRVTLTAERCRLLRKMAGIFAKHNTDYRIVISPNRYKVYLNSADYDSLTNIFGRERVHNYTKTMSHRLETDTLLYDRTHYRPVFASELMDSIYAPL